MPSFVHVTPLPAMGALQRLTYAVPEALSDLVSVGMRVIVPLGPRRVTALVIGEADEAPAGITCRPLVSLLDDTPIVPARLLRLLEWMADYYLAPLGETLSLAIGRALTTASQRMVRLATPGDASARDAAGVGEAPGARAEGARRSATQQPALVALPEAPRDESERAILDFLRNAARPVAVGALAQGIRRSGIERPLAALARDGLVVVEDVLAAPRTKTRYETTIVVERLPDEALATSLFGRAPKRRALFEHLCAQPGRRASLPSLAEAFPSAATSLEALEESGLVRRERTERLRSPRSFAEAHEAPLLTASQQGVVDAVLATAGTFRVHLLQGVTAAGKTEVYLRCIQSVLERGQGALVLVPEISLTHQVVARFRARFGDDVAVLHSELTPGERWDEWRRIARGHARIVVGARSAVLAPVQSLGILVVDEEHDASYKQDDGVRYHARDVAVLRGRLEECPVLLGSATPSLESWRHAIEGRYSHLRLPNRVTPNPPPRIELVDLRGKDVDSGGGLSPELAAALRENFEAGGQGLLFLNRRGYARSLQCWGCGEAVECAACSTGMTVHQGDRSLRCHHCDARRPVPTACPSCGAEALFSQGLGTQRLEATVHALLPGARVARLDRDAVEQRGLLADTLAAWRRGEVDVLIGTQMIAKGHDVPGVTLVGVVQADVSLSVPDFRGAERTFQLVSQVAGRAGRGSDQGRVLVQTWQPEHPAIARAAAHDFDGFAEQELADRAELGYPPFARMAMLRVEGPDRGLVQRLAEQAARAMVEAGRSDPDFVVRGPAPAVIERVMDRYRFHVHARSGSSALVRTAVAAAREAIAPAAREARVRVLVDVDPVDMF